MQGTSALLEALPSVSQEDFHVVMIGLDGAGKTTALYRWPAVWTPLQLSHQDEGGAVRPHRPHCWLQLRAGEGQPRQEQGPHLPRVGRGWPGEGAPASWNHLEPPARCDRCGAATPEAPTESYLCLTPQTGGLTVPDFCSCPDADLVCHLGPDLVLLVILALT